MRIDMALMIWDPGNGRCYADLLAEAVEASRAGEQAGFEGVWLAEHHFQDEGFDISPNPILLGAHIAHHTSTIRIGLGALSLPLWHPVRAAEDIAMLDHMSGGRVDAGFGRGISPRDIVNLNPAADRADPDRSLEVWFEGVDIVLSALKNRTFSYDGKHYRLPQPNIKVRPARWHERDPDMVDADGNITSLELTPHPLQSPHPPFYNVSEYPIGFEFAAEKDMNAVTWFPTGDRLYDVINAYRVAAERVHKTKLGLGERCALLRPALVGSSMTQVREIMEPHMENLGSSMGGLRGKAAFADSHEIDDPSIVEQPWYDFLFDRDQMLVGTPERVIEQLEMFRERYGLEHMLCWLNPYGLSHEHMMRTIDLFGEHIIPKLASTERHVMRNPPMDHQGEHREKAISG